MNRGRQAIESRKFDLAIEMLSQALHYAPDVLEARRLLRAAQIARFRQNPVSGLSAKLQSLGNVFARNKISSLAKKGQGVEAMAEAEKLLAQNPLDPENIRVAVEAAEAAGKPEAAAVTIEAAYEASKSDIGLLMRVAQYYATSKSSSSSKTPRRKPR